MGRTRVGRRGAPAALACSRIPRFTLEDLNRGVEDARFVGQETPRRGPERRVYHRRAVMDTFEHRPGTATLPPRRRAPR
ncbi:hypothetical protein [Streptomyces sp. NRRL F-2664]|uniref:hypothetical protein n=1 Tax=Streptomyces sp. NRRL F-2664 TaxID=1463842 RepID=UPI0005B844FD|nr:hypothetical protein [Streptomyces sp. NRRL F-2664]